MAQTPRPRRTKLDQNKRRTRAFPRSDTSASVDRYREDRARILRDLERESPGLERQREAFCQQLRDAEAEDRNVLARMIAKTSTRDTKRLGALERRVERAAAALRAAMVESVKALRSQAPDSPMVETLDAMTTDLTAALQKQRANAGSVAKVLREGLGKQPGQWGAITHRTVAEIVRETHKAFAASEWRRMKPLETARYYAGVVCMHVRLLPQSDPHKRRHIADVVRRRLNDGKKIQIAAGRLRFSSDFLAISRTLRLSHQ